MSIWNLITENVKIFKPFEKIATPAQRVAAGAAKDDGIEKIGYSEWETLNISSQYYFNSIYSLTANKEKLIKEYREMANFPEVADALDEICDEAICQDDEGIIMSLRVNNDKISNNGNMLKNLQKEYDYILEKVLDFDSNAYSLFKKFYVDAELFGEMIIDTKVPAEGIKKVVLLPAETMIVEYDNYEVIKAFKQKMEANDPRLRIGVGAIQNETSSQDLKDTKGFITMKNNQVAYINSGIMDRTDTQEKLVVGFLDRARIAYRQLKWMEDALLIYRLVRAPERRAFTIDVGNLPTNKVNEYMKNIIQRFKQKKVYNSQTGEIDVGRNIQSMQEDVFLPKRSDGTGPSVQMLEGGHNLGEITDVLYYVKKLYKALQIPVKRVDENSMFDWKGETTSKEEIKFAKFVSRVRTIFMSWIMQIYVTHLRLKGLWKQYGLNPEDISFVFNEENEWRETKKLANFQARITMFNEMSTMNTKVFSLDWMKRNILKLSDEDIEENEKQLKKEQEEQEKENKRKGLDINGNTKEDEDEDDPTKKAASALKAGAKEFEQKSVSQKVSQLAKNAKSLTMPKGA